MAKRYTSSIDSELISAKMRAESKAKENLARYIPPGSIESSFWEDPPGEGLYYDSDVQRWCPESFKEEKEEWLAKEQQRILDETPRSEQEGFSVTGKRLPTGNIDVAIATETNVMAKVNDTENNVNECERKEQTASDGEAHSNPVKPESPTIETMVDTQSLSEESSRALFIENEEIENSPDLEEGCGFAAETTDVAEVTEVTEVTIVDKVNASPKSEVSDSNRDTPCKEQPIPIKQSRISAKMRKATRSEFCEAYTGKVDTKKGKPISIAPSIMERLYRLCSLSGDHNACPTYVINNLLLEFLDAVEPEAKKWGALS